MAGMAAYALPWLLSCALLFISTCRAQDVCTGVSGTVRVDGDCVLRSMLEPGVLQYVLSGSGAAVVYAFGSSSDSAPASSPLQLAISGVTLANFTLASSASSSPLLWPAEAVGAAPAAGSTLDMTDVRLVVSSEALQTFVKAFSRGPAIYTVSVLLHVGIRFHCAAGAALQSCSATSLPLALLCAAGCSSRDNGGCQLYAFVLNGHVWCGTGPCRTTQPTSM
jgi:hypothetical protein